MKKIILYLILVLPITATSEDIKLENKETKILERITIAGSGSEKNAGSVSYLSPAKLEQAKKGFDDVGKVLRQLPGVNVQEEDGFGLRPNIGFRGTSVDRSANITLMEDSVLAAPAPYSAPAAYYFPTLGRMESLEVTKGPGMIKYGPNTTGGSLNLFSTKIPEKFRAKGQFRLGDYNSQISHINLGDKSENFGWMLETYQASSYGFKNLDSGGDTGFDIADYVGKFRVNTDATVESYQELEFKFNVYDQDSEETYLGLTEEDFQADPFRRYSGSQLDNIQVDHTQLMLRHYGELNDVLDLTTSIYRNDTDRIWFKTESVGGAGIASILDDPANYSEQLAWIRGADSAEGAFAIRNNDREYYAQGIQSVLGYSFELGKTEHQLEFGARYHEDEEDRYQQDDRYQMLNNQLLLSSLGEPGSESNRVNSATAWAFFLQDKIEYEKLTMTPGLRYESINLVRNDYGKEDPNRWGESLTTSSNQVDVLIPGLGSYYELSNKIGLFAGIHKGFASPTPGSNDSVQEEESINYESGFDYKTQNSFSKLLFFYNDYENLLGADTLSSGGTGSGDLFNAGESSVVGMEASYTYNVAELVDSAIDLPVQLAYTLTQAEFEESFQSELFGTVTSGDAIPYIAENQLFLSIGAVTEIWSVYLNGNYVDAMPTYAGQAALVSTSNTDSNFVFDLNGEIKLTDNISIFTTIQNLFDDQYAVARRPAGVRPGLPRTFMAGLKFDLG